MMLKNLLYALILICAIPAGYLLAWLGYDELVAGRKWFLMLAVASVLAMIPAFIFLSMKLPAILSLMFLIIICLIAVWKSYDKGWVGKR